MLVSEPMCDVHFAAGATQLLYRESEQELFVSLTIAPKPIRLASCYRCSCELHHSRFPFRVLSWTRVLVQGPGKKWESYDLNKNGKPVRIPMHVKTGDTVVVIAGRDKGKVGEVSKVRKSLGPVALCGASCM